MRVIIYSSLVILLPRLVLADPCQQQNHIYQPSMDVRGKAVAPADLNLQNDLFDSTIELRLTAPPQRFSPNSKAFGEINLGTARINTLDNSVMVNDSVVRDAQRPLRTPSGMPCPPPAKPNAE